MPFTDFYSQLSDISFYPAKDGGLGVRARFAVLSPSQFLRDVCNGIYPECPELPQWINAAEFEGYFQVWIDSVAKAQGCDPATIIDRVVLALFQRLRRNDPEDRQIRALWGSYYRNAYYKVVRFMWNRLPSNLRTPEKFYSLLTESYLLKSRENPEDTTETPKMWHDFPHLMFRRFNLTDPHPNLLNALGAWSFRTIRNGLNSSLRMDEGGYPGLSDLGVLTSSNTPYILLNTAVSLQKISRTTIEEISCKKYPNPNQDGLRQEIINSLAPHIFFDSSGTDELSKRCEILVRCLKECLSQISGQNNFDSLDDRLNNDNYVDIGDLYTQKLAALADSDKKRDLATINDWYQNRKSHFQIISPNSDLPQYLQTIEGFRSYLSSHTQLSAKAVKTFLRAIGRTIRNHVGKIDNPDSFNIVVGGTDGNTEIGDLVSDDTSETPEEFTERELFKKLLPQLTQYLDEFFQLSPNNPRRPSHQQILWLRYGLSLGMAEISQVLHSNFGLAHPNPGGASDRVSDALDALARNLIVSMNQAETTSNNITESDIKARIAEMKPILKVQVSNTEPSLLREYFYQVVNRIVQPLGIQP